jgi:hypothetical protein
MLLCRFKIFQPACVGSCFASDGKWHRRDLRPVFNVGSRTTLKPEAFSQTLRPKTAATHLMPVKSIDERRPFASMMDFHKFLSQSLDSKQPERSLYEDVPPHQSQHRDPGRKSCSFLGWEPHGAQLRKSATRWNIVRCI